MGIGDEKLSGAYKVKDIETSICNEFVVEERRMLTTDDAKRDKLLIDLLEIRKDKW